MSSAIRSFDGSSIEGTITRDGVFAAFDWERLALPPLEPPIRAKARARADSRLRGFPEADRVRLTEKLGHYSDVQSINCEDTVTWSVFGCAAAEAWLNDVLERVFGPADRPRTWRVSLWTRIRHPDTGLTVHGPEADVVIESPGWRYVVEAKWTSDLSVHTGGQDQLQMRSYQARLDGVPPERSGVLVIVPARYRHAALETSNFRKYFEPGAAGHAPRDAARDHNARAILWEQLVETIGDRGRPGLGDYMAWRLSHIRA